MDEIVHGLIDDEDSLALPRRIAPTSSPTQVATGPSPGHDRKPYVSQQGLSKTKIELRAKILATANPKPSPVEVEGWGTVYVKPLTVGDIESFNDDTDPALKAARSIARVLCDESGELLFDPTSAEDLFAINRLPLSAIGVINGAVEKLNGSSEQEAIDLGNVSPPATGSSST